MTIEEAKRILCEKYGARVRQEEFSGALYFYVPCAPEMSGQDLNEAIEALGVSDLPVIFGPSIRE